MAIDENESKSKEENNNYECDKELRSILDKLVSAEIALVNNSVFYDN